MKITIADKGQTVEVADVQRWIDERKQLLRKARELLSGYDGKPASLRPHHGTLVGTARRLSEIAMIFERFNQERMRYADANIVALVKYFEDPRTMEGVDD
ncbi:MAG TPA: hypothetical protein VF643_14330 [Sphingomonas sp.]